MTRRLRYFTVGSLFLLGMIAGACKKHTPPPPPPAPAPAPTAPAPTASLAADPTSIHRGQSATLRWSSQNATDLDLQPGVGRVDPQGSRSVSPSDSTTYTLSVRGAGGSAQATTRLTVTAAPPPPAAVAPRT